MFYMTTTIGEQKMYKGAIALLSGIICLFAATVSAEEAYAVKPEIHQDAGKSFIATGISKATSPAKSEIPAPAYPGALLINSFAGVKSADGGYKRLPYIELISVDVYDVVLAFYQDRLSSWKTGGFNTAAYFAEKGKVNIFNPQSSHVGLHDVSKYYREKEQKDLQKIIPGASTLIKIFYQAR